MKSEFYRWYQVHGDIRHLEIVHLNIFFPVVVHGDIRHLEMHLNVIACLFDVHGDIRHLEIIATVGLSA